MIQGDGAIERLRRTAAVLSEGDVRQSMLAVQASMDVLDGVRAQLFKELGEQRLFESTERRAPRAGCARSCGSAPRRRPS